MASMAPPTTGSSTPRLSTTDNLHRGNYSYGVGNSNSTLPAAAAAAAAVGVKPPADASPKKWKRAWLVQKYATPLLHLWDPVRPPNSSLNLYCLWWKALAGNDRESPAFDDALSFDILPRGTRWMVAQPSLYPRLHHANVEIRTCFLDRSVTRCAQEHPTQRIRLVSLGAGYDVRSIKLKERNVVDRAFELDLPQVVQAKTKILESPRFRRRRPHVTGNVLPTFYPVDLNDLDQVKATLETILQSDTSTNTTTTTTRNDDDVAHDLSLGSRHDLFERGSSPSSFAGVQ